MPAGFRAAEASRQAVWSTGGGGGCPLGGPPRADRLPRLHHRLPPQHRAVAGLKRSRAVQQQHSGQEVAALRKEGAAGAAACALRRLTGSKNATAGSRHAVHALLRQSGRAAPPAAHNAIPSPPPTHTHTHMGPHLHLHQPPGLQQRWRVAVVQQATLQNSAAVVPTARIVPRDATLLHLPGRAGARCVSTGRQQAGSPTCHRARRQLVADCACHGRSPAPRTPTA